MEVQPEMTQMWVSMIVIAVPAVIALLKLWVPRIPKVALPILAPVLGAAADIALHYAGLSDGNMILGAALGAAGTGLREIVDQTKKAATGGPVSAAVIFGLLALGSPARAEFLQDLWVVANPHAIQQPWDWRWISCRPNVDITDVPVRNLAHDQMILAMIEFQRLGLEIGQTNVSYTTSWQGTANCVIPPRSPFPSITPPPVP